MITLCKPEFRQSKCKWRKGNLQILSIFLGKDRKPSGKENHGLECDDLDGIRAVPQFPASPCSKADKVGYKIDWNWSPYWYMYLGGYHHQVFMEMYCPRRSHRQYSEYITRAAWNILPWTLQPMRYSLICSIYTSISREIVPKRLKS